ncbi:DUF2860 domain-containing protein [Vibrio sp. S4M6]|uniref:DUF2860 family protein n=1 Tax=Vibrio sinus TaxID=2946865 RepID=UPI00202A0561|nr:DUF2860 family protein [Vibrio sinus]MCL9781763.1 DUF2860 domain-containing protein [Vibrio sinus]
MRKFTLLLTLSVPTLFQPLTAFASDHINSQNVSTIHGDVGLAFSSGKYSSNFIASDEGDSSAVSNGLNRAPSDESYTKTTPLLDLNYTIGSTDTSLFLSSQTGDPLSQESYVSIGAEQVIGRFGTLSTAYLFSIPGSNKEWADPYATNHKRSSTDTRSQGVSVGWQQILGSQLSASFTHIEKKLDQERGGDSLSELSTSQRNMLDRNGHIDSASVSYIFALSENQSLTPELRYSRYGLNGSAMSHNQFGIGLTHNIAIAKYSLSNGIFWAENKYDEDNPIYNKKSDSNEYYFSSTLTKQQLFGFTQLTGLLSASIGKNKSDIQFFNAKNTSFEVGVAYSF